MSEQVTQEWQEVFQRIIKPMKERKRIADALDVNKVTLSRWAGKNSLPQREDLARLLKVLQPKDRAELLTAIQNSHPDMYAKLQEEVSESVSSAFIREVLKGRASTVETLRPWQVGMPIFDEAIKLLDPHQLGILITPVLCMPPVDGAIRSLREQGGRGITPWTSDLANTSFFLGLTSLAAYVTQTGRARSVQDIGKETYIPVFAYPEDLEKSAAATPLWFEGRIAGCLLAASVRTEHFTQARMDLLTHLASIFALTLNPEAFHEPSLIQLRYMPRPENQFDLLQTFRDRVGRLRGLADLNEQPMSSHEAEIRAWQEIEEELLTQGMNEGKEQG